MSEIWLKYSNFQSVNCATSWHCFAPLRSDSDCQRVKGSNSQHELGVMVCSAFPPNLLLMLGLAFSRKHFLEWGKSSLYVVCLSAFTELAVTGLLDLLCLRSSLLYYLYCQFTKLSSCFLSSTNKSLDILQETPNLKAFLSKYSIARVLVLSSKTRGVVLCCYDCSCLFKSVVTFPTSYCSGFLLLLMCACSLCIYFISACCCCATARPLPLTSLTHRWT